MLKRSFGLAALCLACGAMQLPAQDVFVLPGVGADSGLVETFVPNPLSTITSFNSGHGSFLALPTANGTKFYIIASTGIQTVTATDATFLHPTAVANLAATDASPVINAVVSPDGSVLAVAVAALHLFNTSTDTDLVPSGLSQGSGINTFDLAFSLDGGTIFALGTTGAGGSQLTAFSTATRSATTSLAISQAAKAVTVGPNGLVYVSLPNQILELDPLTLQKTTGGQISVSGTPGRLTFTPDGRFAVAANQVTGAALIVVTLGTHSGTSPNLGLPPITTLECIGTDTVLALAAGTIYQVNLSGTPTVTQLPIAGIPAGVLAIAISNEVPGGTVTTVQNLYAIANQTIYQINLANNFVRQFPLGSTFTAGAVSYAAPPVTTQQARPALLLTYGAVQSILPGAKSAPLVVQVLDANGHPMIGVPVSFQSSSNSAPVSPASVATGANGYALARLTAPSTIGAITVSASVASLPAVAFNINVSSTAGGSGQQLTIIAGQGQLMLTSSTTAAGPLNGSPLEVLVSDATGNPVASVPVTFSVPVGTGNIVVNGQGSDTATVDTGSNGVAQVDFLTTTIPTSSSTGFAQTTVTASALGITPVTFYITTVTKIPSATASVTTPEPGATLSGPEGSTLPGAVSVRVSSPTGGIAIPNVSLIVSDSRVDPNLYPSANCNTLPGDFVLTNSSGLASCDLVFGPRAGAGMFTVTIGYTRTGLAPYGFVVTPGAPASAQITQGNNQVGTPGQTLPLALVVHVTDSGGNTITGAPVTWQVVTTGAVALKNVIGTTDNNGNASALATLGSVGGLAQVKATAGSASATFNLTVNIPTTGIQKVSGDQQTATVSTAFLQPLVVKVVDSNGAGLAGAQVNFQVTAGTATLGSSSAITDSTGQASTTVTAGATAGAITVTATSSTFTTSFTLTAQPLGPSKITIVNGASYDPNTGISPGGIATVRGVGILSGVEGLLPAANSSGQLPTTFSGVTITFDGTPAPIYYVQSTNGADQISVQVPFEVQPGPAVSVLVKNASGSAPITVPVKPLAPGIFTTVYGTKTYAVAVRPDGSQVSPTNPAQRGETIQLYVTGLGQATPTIATGAAGVPNQPLVSSMIVGLNNGGVPLVEAVYGPGLIGVYIVILQIPMDTQTGPYQPIGVIGVDSKGNLYFAQPTYIPIQ